MAREALPPVPPARCTSSVAPTTTPGVDTSDQISTDSLAMSGESLHLPPLWLILSRVPAVSADITQFSVNFQSPPSVSQAILSKEVCQSEATEDNYQIIAVDSKGKLLMYTAGRELAVCELLVGFEVGLFNIIPPPILPFLGLGTIGLISTSEDCTILELRPIHGTARAILQTYYTGCRAWSVSEEFLCDVTFPDDWGIDTYTIFHDCKMHFIDLKYGLLSYCDPFSTQPQLQYYGFPVDDGPSVFADGPLLLYKRRLMTLSDGKLRYIHIHHLTSSDEHYPLRYIRSNNLMPSDEKTPVITMWTLHDQGWYHEYTMPFAEIWLDDTYKRTKLPDQIPNLALINPQNPNLVYFFLGEKIFSVNVPLHKLLDSLDHEMTYLPEPNHSSRCVHGWQLLHDSIDTDNLSLTYDEYSGLDLLALSPDQQLLHQVGGILNNNFEPNTTELLNERSPREDDNIDNNLLLATSEMNDETSEPTKDLNLDNTYVPTAEIENGRLEQESVNTDDDSMPTNIAVQNGRLKVPTNFHYDALLEESLVHGFISAEALRNNINSSTLEWLTENESFALLKNGNTFQNPVASDKQHRADGVCTVVHRDVLPQMCPCDHAYSKFRKQLKEQKIHTSKIAGINLCQYSMKGNKWERRRCIIENNDTYHLIQWRSGTESPIVPAVQECTAVSRQDSLTALPQALMALQGGQHHTVGQLIALQKQQQQTLETLVNRQNQIERISIGYTERSTAATELPVQTAAEQSTSSSAQGLVTLLLDPLTSPQERQLKTLEQLLAVQERQQSTLDRIAIRQDQNERILQEHSSILDNVVKLLDPLTSPQERQVKTLEQLLAVQERQKSTLDRIATHQDQNERILQEHSSILNSVVKQVQESSKRLHHSIPTVVPDTTVAEQRPSATVPPPQNTIVYSSELSRYQGEKRNEE